MDQAPPRRTDAGVGDLADAVVAEIPSLVGLNADDVAPPELVERADERVLFEVAGLRQDVEPEIASHRRRDLGGRARVLREQRQPRGHNGLHSRQRASSPDVPGCLVSSIRPRSTMNSGWPSVSRNVRASAASSSGCSATSPASCAVAA